MVILQYSHRQEVTEDFHKTAFFRDTAFLFLLQNTYKMPPLRSPLQQRDGNSRKAKELTPYQRGKIQGMADKGAGCSTISREYNLPLTTVYNTLQMDTLRDEGKSQPRSGAGKSYTEAEERRIL